jgi:hypothetical protein
MFNVRNDISSATRGLAEGEWKATTVVAGSVVEALLPGGKLDRNLGKRLGPRAGRGVWESGTYLTDVLAESRSSLVR